MTATGGGAAAVATTVHSTTDWRAASTAGGSTAGTAGSSAAGLPTAGRLRYAAAATAATAARPTWAGTAMSADEGGTPLPSRSHRSSPAVVAATATIANAVTTKVPVLGTAAARDVPPHTGATPPPDW